MSCWRRPISRRYRRLSFSSSPMSTRSSSFRQCLRAVSEPCTHPNSPYPIRRTLPLIEAISQDFNDQLLRVMGSQRLMYMDYGKFESVMSLASSVFTVWDENMKDFTNVAREGMSFAPIITVSSLLVSIPKTGREIHLYSDQPGSFETSGAHNVSTSLSTVP